MREAGERVRRCPCHKGGGRHSPSGPAPRLPGGATAGPRLPTVSFGPPIGVTPSAISASPPLRAALLPAGTVFLPQLPLLPLAPLHDPALAGSHLVGDGLQLRRDPLPCLREDLDKAACKLRPFLVVLKERERVASHPGEPACSPTDAVDVVVHVAHVVNDHVSDLRDVEAPAHDVCGHQQPRLSALEGIKDLHSHALRPPSVHGVRLEALLEELVPHLVGHGLVVDEDEGLVILALQHPPQVAVEDLPLGLVALLPGVLVEDNDLLCDVCTGGRHAVFVLPDREPHGLHSVPAEGLRQVLHRRWPSRGEEEHVSVAPDGRRDLADVILEAKVQHPVGLVEHEVRHPAERELLVLQEVHQPPGRRDEDVAAAPEVPQLLHLVLAAVDARGPDAAAVVALCGLLEELVRLLGDLDRQLAGWSHDQCDGRDGVLTQRLLCLDVYDGWQ
mmetsp:Transcript_26053/g.77824  ORF Transcript_26053/g.77824 Transcript_26053/m.77824 type:complete len:446 (+) Transcript_26053:205-1542(+)